MNETTRSASHCGDSTYLHKQSHAVFPSSSSHFSSLAELDKAHIFQMYFPYNNLDRILQLLASKYEENLKYRNTQRRSEVMGSRLEKFMQQFNSRRANGPR